MTELFDYVRPYVDERLRSSAEHRETALAVTIDRYERPFSKHLYMIVERHPSLGLAFNRGELPPNLVYDGATWWYATEGPGFGVYVRPRRLFSRDDRRRWRTETRTALRLLR